MSKLYGRSDIDAVSLNGHEHVRATGDKHIVVDCDQCSDFLVKVLGFSAREDQVPLTPDEVLNEERAAKEGSVTTQLVAQRLAEVAKDLAGIPPTNIAAPAPRRRRRNTRVTA